MNFTTSQSDGTFVTSPGTVTPQPGVTVLMQPDKDWVWNNVVPLGWTAIEFAIAFFIVTCGVRIAKVNWQALRKRLAK